MYFTVTTSRILKQHTVVICDCDVHCKDKYMPCAGENQESFFCVITGYITLQLYSSMKRTRRFITGQYHGSVSQFF